MGENGNQTITDKSVNKTNITGLDPGTSVTLTITTLLNGQSIGVYPYNTVNTPADVTNVSITQQTTTNLVIKFDKPDGYYDKIAAFSYIDNPNYGLQQQTIGPNIFTISFDYLIPGSNVTIFLGTLKAESDSEGLVLSSYTPMSAASCSGDTLSGTSLNLNLNTPSDSGDYESINITLTLIATSSNQYFRNKTFIPPECKLNTVLTYPPVLSTDFLSVIPISDLCPLSTYNVTLTTIKTGFVPAVDTCLVRTSYENVECKNAQLVTVGPNNTFSWPNSSMIVTTYVITVLFNQSVIFTKSVPFGQNSVQITLANNQA
jgi:hypothetical protein